MPVMVSSLLGHLPLRAKLKYQNIFFNFSWSLPFRTQSPRDSLAAWRPAGLEAWRPAGPDISRPALSARLVAWRAGGLEAWSPGGLAAWRPQGLRSYGLGLFFSRVFQG